MIHRVVLFGPQGSGKGTQGEKLAEFLNIPLIVTGNIFRYNIKEKTALGELAQQYINKGELVPNEVTIRMIKERLLNSDCANGYILDGFPRTLTQAEALDNITHVLLIDITDDEAVRRIADRRQCLHCGMTYHPVYKPSKQPDICNKCGEKLVQRDDDTKEALQRRLNLYHQESEPLLSKYQIENILYRIDGSKSIPEVWEAVKKIFAK